MNTFQANLINDLEQQFDAEAAKPGAEVSKLEYLARRIEGLANSGIESLYATRRHVRDELERQRRR